MSIAWNIYIYFLKHLKHLNILNIWPALVIIATLTSQSAAGPLRHRLAPMNGVMRFLLFHKRGCLRECGRYLCVRPVLLHFIGKTMKVSRAIFFCAHRILAHRCCAYCNLCTLQFAAFVIYSSLLLNVWNNSSVMNLWWLQSRSQQE